MVKPTKPQRLPGGRVTRVAPLVGLAGRTAGEMVVASLRNRRRGQRDNQWDGVEFHTRNAERYAERLGRSRGVLMKAGQILSVVMPESAVSSEYRGIYQAAFAKLQDDAPPMPVEIAIDTITAELGRSPAELFAEFDEHPLAAASIGQVYTARMPDGRRVVIKVQYPGVEEAIRADLKNTELLSTFLQLLFTMMPDVTSVDVRAMAHEISERIGEEIDYRIEATNQREFADAFRGHPFVHIPEVLPELTTRRVLTMEFVDGLRYAKAVTAEQELRDRWGEAIYRFTAASMRSLRLVNTDPHPGNYLFHPDGSVTFLDFGCVKRFTEEQARVLIGLLQRVVDQDAEGLYQWSIESGFLNPVDPPTPADLLGWWSASYQYLLAPQPFTFTPEYLTATMRNRLSSTGPYNQVLRKLSSPGEYTMASRMDIGVTAVLTGLRATGDWNAIRNEWYHDEPPTTEYGELEAAFWARWR